MTTHSLARTAVTVGAVGAAGLMLFASRASPLLLRVLFVGWVLMPFVVLAWAHQVAPRWSILTQTALYGTTLVVTVGTLTLFSAVIALSQGPPRAPVFVVVPPASCVLLAIVVPLAALKARKRGS